MSDAVYDTNLINDLIIRSVRYNSKNTANALLSISPFITKEAMVILNYYNWPVQQHVLNSIQHEEDYEGSALYPVTTSLMTDRVEVAKRLLSKGWNYPKLRWNQTFTCRHPFGACRHTRFRPARHFFTPLFLANIRPALKWRLARFWTFEKKYLEWRKSDQWFYESKCFTGIHDFWAHFMDNLDRNLKELIEWDEKRRMIIGQILVKGGFAKDVVFNNIIPYAFDVIPDELRDHNWRPVIET